MKTPNFNPKILPWLAHKAGVPLHRVEVLWKTAQCHAALLTGETATPAYWEASMDRLVELVAAESLQEDAASFGWRRWTRMNRRAWQTPLEMLDAWSLNLVRSLRRWEPLHLS